VGGVAGVAIGLASAKIGRPPEPAVPLGGGALMVSTTPVSPAPGYALERIFTGRIEAARSSEIGFELGGLLREVLVEEGDRLAQGQVLARLDTARLEARRAELHAALAEAEANRDLAAVTVERMRGVVEAGGISRQGLDEAREAHRAAQAAVALARSRIDSLDVDLAKAELRAPFAGTVVARRADEGRVLAAGEPLVRLQEQAPHEARVGVAGDLVDHLATDRLYELRASGQRLSARLKAVLPVRRAGSRTVDALFVLADELDALRPGDLVELTLEQTVPEPGVWLPVGALTEGARGLWSVLVAESVGAGRVAALTATHRLQGRVVDVLHAQADRVYVRGTLNAGEAVVVDGLHRVVPGQLVRLAGPGAEQLAREDR
jgi:RND family efflux transporter MFP subunit